ncbi:hypothetical protein CFN58_00220 [Pseudomonas avellanae]|uniref:Uncharacterized protein n=2 Tax=Pseudomonas syringae group TaxID=136849 RepID=A0A261WP61_9PSED|nr:MULTISPECIES: hypothetical protein [Pseudomonas syringae group]ATV20546.1 hypothetical protein CT122_30085 [Pseudomonas syringae pv. actinidiae]OZI87966.1 hypothetical protein CFN58_00220 [Pseudomonas avellanae]PIN60981.1 hypothetical protein CUB86_13425 [Pseudomonas syringae pv. actinidiae]GAO92941.1 hypothetical protein PSA5_09510 [Pseudomonas syringae pv. actinidiae]
MNKPRDPSDSFFVPYSRPPSQDSINCFLATVESYCQQKELVESFDLAHFEHEFHIIDGANTDIIDGISALKIESAWECRDSVSMLSDRVIRRIRERHGLAISLEIINDKSAYLRRLEQMGFDAICIFDNYLMSESYYYKRWHGFSVCILNGYDPVTDRYGLLERKHGQSFASTKDMYQSADYFIESLGGSQIFHPVSVPVTTVAAEIELRSDLERILETYHDEDPYSGQKGLQLFSKTYPKLIEKNTPFLIHWSQRGYGERYANHRFFNALRTAGHSASASHQLHWEYISVLYKELGDLWRSFEMFHVYSVAHSNPAILKRNLPLLSSIISKEHQCMVALEKLHTLI